MHTPNPQDRRSGPALAVAAYVLALAGQTALGVYVLASGLHFWPRGEPAAGPVPWLVDLGWLVLFAGQHSGMARRPFKEWLTRRIPPPLERSAYVAASGLVTLAQPWVWQPLPGDDVWAGPVWIIGISLAALVGTGLCCAAYDHLGFMGLRPPAPEPLRITGPYRWVRHPLMFGMLVFVWAQPSMPPELLLLNAGLTVYVLAAIRLEERDLVRQYGAQYEAYRRRVPALVPWRGPMAPAGKSAG